jgi:hypothetical protein
MTTPAVITDSTVRVTLKHGTQHYDTFLDKRLLRDQLARVIGVTDERVTVIHKGRKLADGAELLNGSTLLVMCSTGKSWEKARDDTLGWFSPLASWLPPAVTSTMLELVRYLQSWWAWLTCVVPASEALVAVDGEVYELKLRIGIAPNGRDDVVASVVSASQVSAHVSWTAADCGEFVDNSEASKTLGCRFNEELCGPGPWDLCRALMSNGLAGVVTCEVREVASGKLTSQHFWLKE